MAGTLTSFRRERGRRSPTLAATILFLAGTGLCTGACAGDEAKPAADLPGGWETAIPIDDFRQTACEGSPYDGAVEMMAASAEGRSVHIVYQPAHFRCAQAVQGFARTTAQTVDVIVQPVDMNPASIAKCDCLYATDMGVPVQSGIYSVAVYRRWDHKSGADTPLKIGSDVVTIP